MAKDKFGTYLCKDEVEHEPGNALGRDDIGDGGCAGLGAACRGGRRVAPGVKGRQRRRWRFAFQETWIWEERRCTQA